LNYTYLVVLIDVASNLIRWEDFKVGEAAELGRHTFTEAEIVASAGSTTRECPQKSI
jgi:hypothetical protein